ncbi:flagellar basal body rod C-terminal domain-containing protein [Hydrogenimonas sp.]
MTGNITSMQAHTAWMNQNAHNVANVSTEGFDAARTVPAEGPRAVSQPTGRATDLARELPEQVAISGGFSAQVASVKTYDGMLGTLLDMKG